jgi:pyrimidine operon attenuation protein/uracil phosphoribosyltransferase
MEKNLTQAEMHTKIKALAAKLHAALPPPTEKDSYELIGIGKLGMSIAIELQNFLSALWKNPIGLSIIVLRLNKAAKTWTHTSVEYDPKFHTRKIIVDGVSYTGKTYRELLKLYPDSNFAVLYALKELANCYAGEMIERNLKINFPNKTEEN